MRSWLRCTPGKPGDLVLLGVLALVLPTGALAAPTHAEIEGAAWRSLGEKEHADAGKVELFQATLHSVDCYRAVARTEVSASVLFGIITNPVAAKQWSSANITEAEILSRQGDQLDYFQHLSAPGWTMMADRFWFSHGQMTDTPELKAWRYQKLVDGGPYQERYQAHKAAHPSALEPETSVGGWYFRPVDGGTEVSFLVCADIGGSVPGSVERFATRRTLPDTVGDLVREGRRRAGK